MNLFQRISIYFVLVILAIPALLPMAWMTSTSLKSDKQIFATEGKAAPTVSLRSLVPSPVQWKNYPDALSKVPFRTYLRNTVMLCAVTVFGVVLSSAIVAYGFARCTFAGKPLFFIAMISTMAVPPQVTMVPIFVLFKWLGWYGTYLPLIVPAFFGGPFYIFLLTQFFRKLPEDMAEAARLDGAGDWGIFTRIVLPLAKPALATCAIFQFIGTWNDFLGPLLYLNKPSNYTVAYGLQQFMSKNGGQWSLLMAGATIFTLPLIILFFFAQKTFIQGIATTGARN
ncbi:carbohydrate ABC transporter permease [Fimbriimonas ginsengisoli]|uniref:Putative rhamnose oligosaccharide ABC transport system, permease component n=1 Tax=Fimbriimonas ginsengisoli Gsoil 348 TaxID=661478 RepID=A0A068NTB2_FIMGI|nr:carbohydrate ABC transporter permease [Fimbriimonas ginsengisoli]AIE86005.1 putative rhamnose oligosaccharide ABC transport system, permease component [Fimbriimonas ginsengisoli Gsoil 348]